MVVSSLLFLSFFFFFHFLIFLSVAVECLKCVTVVPDLRNSSSFCNITTVLSFLLYNYVHFKDEEKTPPQKAG